VQDYSSGGRGEKITLGYVTLNLAEYVEESEAVAPDGEEGITRRYLMQESKINSTLKIGIAMKQIDGEKSFVAPPLKTAPVFGGIAGIMAGEQGEKDDMGCMPSINKSRDASELQDMYRRTLAASWVAQSGELPADQFVEDIFAGGDGWNGNRDHSNISTPQLPHDDSASASGDDQHHQRLHHRRTQSGASSRSQTTITRKNNSRMGHKHTESKDSTSHGLGLDHSLGVDSRGSLESRQHGTSSEKPKRGRTGFKYAHEVDEFEVRDDLVAWRLPGTVSL